MAQDPGTGRSPDLAERLLLLRGRARLSQLEVAGLVGVSGRAVRAWEAGLNHPSEDRLRALIALYLHSGAFTRGQERAEASALWETARRESPRLRQGFDAGSFGMLLPPATTGMAGTGDAAPEAARPLSHDWGDAPTPGALQGRTIELDLLMRWVATDACRVVTLLGVGGIGKTSLAAELARRLAPHVTAIFWRSVRNGLPFSEWLDDAIHLLSDQREAPSLREEDRLRQLLELLRERRCLLVLDNLETVLEAGADPPVYRTGYDGYGRLLQRLGEVRHQSCLLVTSREKPPELTPLEGARGAVRTLRLEGLSETAIRSLVADRSLAGSAADWATLVGRYAGNALALLIVSATIRDVFDGDIARFLLEGQAVYGGIRRLLDAQFARLTPAECTVLYWLAIEREPVRLDELAADARPALSRRDTLEAVVALGRRSLLEHAEGGAALTVQPVVLEYVTGRLVEQVHQEIERGAPDLLVSHGLVKAHAREYVRKSQERLIGGPILQQLTASSDKGGTERRLLALLETSRHRPLAEQGYGPGNVENLLRLLRGNLRGLDLSGLAIRQAYLAEVDAQDASLVDAQLMDAVLAEAFHFPGSVALSGDGALLAAGTSTGEVWLWRTADHTPLWVLRGHAGGVFGVALSADGRMAVSGGMDGSVRLWDAETGRPMATFEGLAGGVWSVAVSGDGHLAASGGGDGAVRLWNTRTGRPLATLQGHTGVVRGVALSADGSLVASGGNDGTVRLWEADTGRPMAILQGHTGAVSGVALSGDGHLVVSGSADGTVRLWETGSRRPRATLQGHEGTVWVVALAAGGHLAASGGGDGTVRLWDTRTGQPLAILQGHTGTAWVVALSADGRLAASGGVDGTVRLWEADTGRPLATLQGQNGAVWGAALSTDGRLVASSRIDGTVRLWEAASGRPLATLQGHGSWARGVALSADRRLLASGGLDGTVRLWEANTGRPLATLQGHTGMAWSVALSADGSLVASAGMDGTVRLWEVDTGRPLATLQGHVGALWGVALSADGRLLASSGGDGTVRLWDTRTGQSLTTLQGHTGAVWGVALSTDGRLVASGGGDGTVRLWDTRTGRPLAMLQGHTGSVSEVALSADGRLLASGGADGTVRLWETEAGRPVATLEGHTGAVWGVALAADGHLVASASMDGAVRLWESGTGRCLHVLRPERRYERMDITGLTGITEAQRQSLIALGAVDRDRAGELAGAGSAHASSVVA